MAVTAKRPLVVKRIEISSFGLASEWHCFSGDRYPERFSRVYRKPTNSVGLVPRSSASKRGLSTPWHWPTPERPLVLHPNGDEVHNHVFEFPLPAATWT